MNRCSISFAKPWVEDCLELNFKYILSNISLPILQFLCLMDLCALAYETSLILQAQDVRRALETIIHFHLFPQNKQQTNQKAVHMNIIMIVVNFFTGQMGKQPHNYIHVTAFWFVFCKVNANSSAYRHPSQRLHISSSLAPLSEHHRTQEHSAHR